MSAKKGKTISEKILSNKSKLDAFAGYIVDAEVDYVMVNDVTGPIAFKEFEGLGCELHRQKVVLVPDPNNAITRDAGKRSAPPSARHRGR